MLIKKVPPSSSKGKPYSTTYYWSSDGWVYDSAKMVRRKYQVMGGDIFQLTEEPVVKMVFSGVEYTETLEITVISESPRIWIEKGTHALDMFQEV